MARDRVDSPSVSDQTDVDCPSVGAGPTTLPGVAPPANGPGNAVTALQDLSRPTGQPADTLPPEPALVLSQSVSEPAPRAHGPGQSKGDRGADTLRRARAARPVPRPDKTYARLTVAASLFVIGISALVLILRATRTEDPLEASISAASPGIDESIVPTTPSIPDYPDPPKPAPASVEPSSKATDDAPTKLATSAPRPHPPSSLPSQASQKAAPLPAVDPSRAVTPAIPLQDPPLAHAPGSPSALPAPPSVPRKVVVEPWFPK